MCYNTYIIIDLFWGAVWTKIKGYTTVTSGKFKTVFVFCVDGIDTSKDSSQWSITQIQAIATISICIDELLGAVEMSEHCLKLRISFWHVWIECRIFRDD